MIRRKYNDWTGIHINTRQQIWIKAGGPCSYSSATASAGIRVTGGIYRGKGAWDRLREQGPEWLHNKYTQFKWSRSFKKHKRKNLFTSQRTSVAISFLFRSVWSSRIRPTNGDGAAHRGEESRGEERKGEDR